MAFVFLTRLCHYSVVLVIRGGNTRNLRTVSADISVFSLDTRELTDIVRAANLHL